MFDSTFEPTISEIMGEPMVRALMKADRVDARAFERRLRLMAESAKGETEDGDGEDDVPGRYLPALAASLKGAAERCCRC